MRRIRLFLTLAVIIATLSAFAAAPVMAHDDDHWRDDDDHEVFEVDDADFEAEFHFFDHHFLVDHFCPFWGDFEGPVNQWDCFD